MSRTRSRYGRNINGIILLDKPFGLSSNSLLQKVKRLFRANKAGHTGALDPMATGMLPICFGEATKFSQHLLDAEKRYRVIAQLGERTDTSDAEGQLINVRPVNLDRVQLAQAIEHFRVQTHQLPSMFSALKHQGRPLYKYARKGIEVTRKTRPIHIYNLQLIHWYQTSIELEIHCSKGTYIRTFIDNFGEHLGCGAHVTMLRRLTVAQYPVARMVTLTSLQFISANAPEAPETLARLDALLLPMDSAVASMPVVKLPIVIATKVRLGQTVLVPTTLQNGLVRMIEEDSHHFFGIGEISELKYLSPRRIIA